MAAALSAGCTLGCFLMMARHGQLPHATVLGAILLLGALAGLFSALGMLAPPYDAVPVRRTPIYPLHGERAWLAPICTVPAAATLLVVVGSVFGMEGLPYSILGALLMLLGSAVRRPTLLVFVIASALYLPTLGSYGLWDPWETHYGEVAGEIMSRDDWISLWQGHDRWFFSKPILIFWAEALSWSATGVGFGADEHAAYTEWVLRLPVYAMGVASLLAVHFAVARIWNKRAGVLAAVVLATTPYYAFLARQAVTDMPFVANMTVAMMLLMIACNEDPVRLARTLRIGRLGFSLQHVVIALVVLVALPQLLYLASRNISWIPPFTWHRDAFLYGSPGNDGVPGNVANEPDTSVISALWCQPLVEALVLGIALAFIVWGLTRERRAQALYVTAFYVFCALAFMAKGIPGFALPGLIALFYLTATRRFDLLFDGRLQIGRGILIVCTLGLPWFVAMYVRHGRGFIDRILIHDHINRLTSGVHGDNASIQYYIWQLGYGMFPWVALIPVALMFWFAQGARARQAATLDPGARKRQDALHMLGLWFAVSFTLFSAMTTKFHHYILPAVPPLAVMVGLTLDRLLPRGLFRGPRRAAATAAAISAPWFLVLGLAGLRGDVRGVIPADVPEAQSAHWLFAHPWATWKCVLLLVTGVVVAGFVLLHARAERFAAASARAEHAKLGPALIAGAIVCAFAGRDLSWHINGEPPGSERLIHLFVYKYERLWPSHLDYRAILFGFAAVAVLLSAACAMQRLRVVAAPGLIGVALAFCVFCLDVYMLDLTPHWTQRGLIERYYAERASAEEPLLAWQMNWKGENFYTGNHVYMFYDLDNKELNAWIGSNKGRRVYFILEHKRLQRLQTLLAAQPLEVLTDKRECNKFLLARTTL